MSQRDPKEECSTMMARTAPVRTAGVGCEGAADIGVIIGCAAAELPPDMRRLEKSMFPVGCELAWGRRRVR